MEARLLADVKEAYGVTADSYETVAGGWLNQKWKLTAGRNALLLKQFALSRYAGKKLAQVEQALVWQQSLRKAGLACPGVYSCRGRLIRWLDGETAYMLMDFCPGDHRDSRTASGGELYSLGRTCARLHSLAAGIGTGELAFEQGDLLDVLYQHQEACLQNRSEDAPEAYRQALEDQKRVVASLSSSFLEGLPRGIAHRDLSSDNFLFLDGEVSALLDFDRSRYSYQWQDVGRALLSLAVRDGGIDADRVRAFREGYASLLPLSKADVIRAIRLSWCVEAPWWIKPAFFLEAPDKIARFREEMVCVGGSGLI